MLPICFQQWEHYYTSIALHGHVQSNIKGIKKKNELCQYKWLKNVSNKNTLTDITIESEVKGNFQ